MGQVSSSHRSCSREVDEAVRRVGAQQLYTHLVTDVETLESAHDAPLDRR